MKTRRIKLGNLILTTRECGPKDAPIRAEKHGSVIKIKDGRYLVLFGGTPEDMREIWLDAADIKLPPTLDELQAQKKK